MVLILMYILDLIVLGNLMYVSEKVGQSTVVIHYCALSQFFFETDVILKFWYFVSKIVLTSSEKKSRDQEKLEIQG